MLLCDRFLLLFFFFFNDTATTEIYTLSLHDALPIYLCSSRRGEAPFNFRFLISDFRFSSNRLLTSAATNDEVRRNGFLLQDRPHRGQRRGGAGGGLAGEQFVENCAKAPDIRGRSDLARMAGGLFGSHVIRRAEDRAADG